METTTTTKAMEMHNYTSCMWGTYVPVTAAAGSVCGSGFAGSLSNDVQLLS